MTTLNDDDLVAYADRVKGKIVVITGGAGGIGKETCMAFARYGATVVIGDVDEKGGVSVVDDIKKAGGESAFLRCDVRSWDDQVSLFELAFSRYGCVDIVIANAGILDKVTDSWTGELKGPDGRLLPPSLKVMDVNVTGALYTARLAIYYFTKKSKSSPQDLKSLVLIGSLASWVAFPFGAPLYSTSKHAVLGAMRALSATLPGEPDTKHIRLSCIHPWFADTNILNTPTKLALAGIPLTPIPRVALAILNSATDPDVKTNGSAYMLLDDGPVLRLEKEMMKRGVYEVMNARVQWIQNVTGNRYVAAVLKEAPALFGWKLLLGVPVLSVAVSVAFVKLVKTASAM